MTSKRFHDKMVIHLNEYRDNLILIKSNEKVISNCAIVNEFINYLHDQHLISDYEQITVSIANSKFHNHYEKRSKKVISKQTIKYILHEFFIFVYEKYGIKNDKLMNGLKRDKISKNPMKNL